VPVGRRRRSTVTGTGPAPHAASSPSHGRRDCGQPERPAGPAGPPSRDSEPASAAAMARRGAQVRRVSQRRAGPGLQGFNLWFSDHDGPVRDCLGRAAGGGPGPWAEPRRVCPARVTRTDSEQWQRAAPGHRPPEHRDGPAAGCQALAALTTPTQSDSDLATRSQHGSPPAECQPARRDRGAVTRLGSSCQ
jgi:hypothetical protein